MGKMSLNLLNICSNAHASIMFGCEDTHILVNNSLIGIQENANNRVLVSINIRRPVEKLFPNLVGTFLLRFLKN